MLRANSTKLGAVLAYWDKDEIEKVQCKCCGKLFPKVEALQETLTESEIRQWKFMDYKRKRESISLSEHEALAHSLIEFFGEDHEYSFSILSFLVFLMGFGKYKAPEKAVACYAKLIVLTEKYRPENCAEIQNSYERLAQIFDESFKDGQMAIWFFEKYVQQIEKRYGYNSEYAVGERRLLDYSKNKQEDIRLLAYLKENFPILCEELYWGEEKSHSVYKKEMVLYDRKWNH